MSATPFSHLAPFEYPGRTGLPPELSGLAGEDDSDEEYSDEDDEDSNGALSFSVRAGHIGRECSFQLKTGIRTTIPTKKNPIAQTIVAVSEERRSPAPIRF